MNRFFRSALFPLVVIVLLVYLASQTLMPRRDNGKDLTYSQLIDETKKGNVSEVTFSPNRQSIEAVLDSGTKVKVNYPSPESQANYEKVLQANNVTYDSKGIGTSAWWALLTKPERRENDVECRYIGFEIPNRFVIGYGLDFAERYRNLPYIGVIRDELVAEAESE